MQCAWIILCHSPNISPSMKKMVFPWMSRCQKVGVPWSRLLHMGDGTKFRNEQKSFRGKVKVIRETWNSCFKTYAFFSDNLGSYVKCGCHFLPDHWSLFANTHAFHMKLQHILETPTHNLLLLVKGRLLNSGETLKHGKSTWNTFHEEWKIKWT